MTMDSCRYKMCNKEITGHNDDGETKHNLWSISRETIFALYMMRYYDTKFNFNTFFIWFFFVCKFWKMIYEHVPIYIGHSHFAIYDKSNRHCKKLKYLKQKTSLMFLACRSSSRSSKFCHVKQWIIISTKSPQKSRNLWISKGLMNVAHSSFAFYYQVAVLIHLNTVEKAKYLEIKSAWVHELGQ